MSNEINILLAQRKEFKIVKVEFPNGTRLYSYKTLLPVVEEDFVVVPVQNSEFPKVAKIVKIIELHEINYPGDVSWVISQVNTDNYYKCVEMEDEAKKIINKAHAKRIQKDMETELEASRGTEALENAKKLVRL